MEYEIDWVAISASATAIMAGVTFWSQWSNIQQLKEMKSQQKQDKRTQALNLLRGRLMEYYDKLDIY